MVGIVSWRIIAGSFLVCRRAIRRARRVLMSPWDGLILSSIIIRPKSRLNYAIIDTIVPDFAMFDEDGGAAGEPSNGQGAHQGEGNEGRNKEKPRSRLAFFPVCTAVAHVPRF